MAYSAEAFDQAKQPGRGSAVGDFVPGKNGGWVPSNHPDAATDTPLPGLSSTRVEGDPGGLPAAGGGNMVGANMGEAGPTMAMAFDGLKNAAGGGGGGMAGGVEQMSAPSSGNPLLGQRIYPQGGNLLRQAFPRIY